jgi:hypothetical protein
MIDLVLWANTKADLNQFAINRGLRVPTDTGEHEYRNIKGFTYCWWRGTSGKLESQMRTEWATDTIDQEDTGLGEVAINVGPTPPAWVEDPLELMDTGGTVADFNRIQGNFAVFDVRPGETVSVGDTVTAWEPTQYLPGFVALIRLHGRYAAVDAITDTGFSDTGDPDQVEQWSRSRVARAIKRNATASDTGAEIPYYEWDGVRIYHPNGLTTYLQSRNIPGHIWMGGNQF